MNKRSLPVLVPLLLAGIGLYWLLPDDTSSPAGRTNSEILARIVRSGDEVIHQRSMPQQSVENLRSSTISGEKRYTFVHLPAVVPGSPLETIAVQSGTTLTPAPKLLVASAPIFPWQASAAGLENGQVIVEFTVRADGTVANPRAIESTSPLFEMAAIDAVSQYLFQPAEASGLTIEAAKILEHVNFDIHGSNLPPPTDSPKNHYPNETLNCLGSAADTRYWWMKAHRTDRSCRTVGSGE